MVIVCILIGVCVTQVFAFVKLNCKIHLEFNHFIEFKFYLKKTLSKYWTLSNDMYAELFRVKCANTCNLHWNTFKKDDYMGR